MQQIHHSWREVLAAPAPASHVLQLYDNDDFLAAGVAHFAAEGLSRGEAVLLSGTGAHLVTIERALANVGIDAQAKRDAGQLSFSNVEDALAHVAPNGVLDEERFEALTLSTLERAAADERFRGVRWWGEITNTLHHRGAQEAGLLAEHLADQAARKHGVIIFCSFMCDRYDAQHYCDALSEMCSLHSHVIPAEDYARHRMAVNRAIADVLGELRGALLQSLASWKGPKCNLPSSQAALFWLRDTLPEHFDAVLRRARMYHLDDGAPQ